MAVWPQLIMICSPPSLSLSLPPPQVCPLIHALLSTVDASLVQDVIGKLQPGDRGCFLSAAFQGQVYTLCPPQSRCDQGPLEKQEDPASERAGRVWQDRGGSVGLCEPL